MPFVRYLVLADFPWYRLKVHRNDLSLLTDSSIRNKSDIPEIRRKEENLERSSGRATLPSDYGPSISTESSLETEFLCFLSSLFEPP